MTTINTTATISWTPADKWGPNRLVLTLENGDNEWVEHDEPITASTDSNAIAAKFGLAHGEIDHDGKFVHVTYQDEA